jgi:hypothetical protein
MTHTNINQIYALRNLYWCHTSVRSNAFISSLLFERLQFHRPLTVMVNSQRRGEEYSIPYPLAMRFTGRRS